MIALVKSLLPILLVVGLYVGGVLVVRYILDRLMNSDR
jgi:hypothetical protein